MNPDLAHTNPNLSPASISFTEAMRFWFKLGFISFGGPAGQIAIMYRELVDEKRWISESRFLHALNYCMVLPGPEAQQLATYLGWLMHGKLGGIIAGALFVLPSLAILIALSWVYLTFGDNPIIAGIFYGIKPAVTAIVAQAAWRIGNRTLNNRWLVAIAVLAFVAIFVFNVAFPLIVIGAALLGLMSRIGGRNLLTASATSATPIANATRGTPALTEFTALLNDTSSSPPHLIWRPRRAIITAAVGVSLWLGAMGLLVANGGVNSTLSQMGWFFTKAAMMTFGGAYAVLPYVYQGAVENFQWLTATQMIDGLALGETTPGPLIMVVAFVGYLGGVTNDVVAGQPFFSGALAAIVVTFFTFLPSFLFIFIGGPFIESTRGNLALQAPLTAITAAVVGVILNLAVFFTWHVWWPQGKAQDVFAGGIDFAAVAITLAATLALTRFKVNVIWVMVGCGFAGYILTALVR